MLQANINILKNLEGFRPEAYKDSVGVWTIGYGYTVGVREGDKVTESEAELQLRMYLSIFVESIVNSATEGLGLKQTQKDALSILAYNIGIYALLGSTLLKKIKAKANRDEIEFHWKRWVYAGGQVLEGLKRRRQIEIDLYFSEQPEKEEVTEEEKEDQQKIEDRIKCIQYTIREETTVDDFLKSKNSYLTKNISKKEFLSFEFENISNNVSIFSEYTQSEKNDSNNVKKLLNNDLDIIKPNTTVYIPNAGYNDELVAALGDNNFLSQDKDLQVYLTDKRLELINDPFYSKLEVVTRNSRISSVQTIEQNCQVWLYVKSIDKLLDISPFINRLTTSKTDIGSFYVDLNSIEVEIDRDTGEITEIFISKNNKKEFLNHYEILKNDKINQGFWAKYCQQNDAIFIRFEKLKSDENVYVSHSGANGIEIDKHNISKQNWDMIGLVDSVSISVNPSSTEHITNISGRDFMKVLVEDGSYLMGLIYARGAENSFYFLGNEEGTFFKRNYVSNGAFEYLFKEHRDSLDVYMGFIINQLSSVSWTGENDLFDYYPEEDRPSKYRIGITNEGVRYLDQIEKNGIWKICKIKVDPALEDRRIVDTSILNSDGTLYEQFKKVCQHPFVEFWGDTFKNEFNFVARQQPFDRKGMYQIVDNKYYIEVDTKDILQIDLDWETEFYSWFQFFPSNQLFSDDEYFYASQFPIIYLDKYIEHFGNHKYVVNDNYLSGKAIDTGYGQEDMKLIARALFNDLKYVIESFSVLPFTRSGRIVINGDRRIKKGDFIHLKATNEICYVESVNNSVSFSRSIVDRTTSLFLKRCMSLPFIKGVSVGEGVELLSDNKFKSKEEIQFISKIRSEGGFVMEDLSITPKNTISYFDIVRTDVIIEDLLQRYEGSLESFKFTKPTSKNSVDFGVNEDVFNFFLQRRQMDESI